MIQKVIRKPVHRKRDFPEPKSLNTCFIPRYEGDYTIPELKFSYFDPSTKKI